MELKGISATFLFLSLIALTEPQDSSIHFSRADSEASPATSRFRMGNESCPALNWARLHRPAMRARPIQVTELLSKEAPLEGTQEWVLLTLMIPSYQISIWLRSHLSTALTRLVLGGVGLVDLVVEPHVGHSHPVLGQGAGLVRADGGGGAQGFHSFQVLHQAVLLSHTFGSQGQTYLQTNTFMMLSNVNYRLCVWMYQLWSSKTGFLCFLMLNKVITIK